MNTSQSYCGIWLGHLGATDSTPTILPTTTIFLICGILVTFLDIFFVKDEYTQSQRWQCISLRFMACLGIWAPLTWLRPLFSFSFNTFNFFFKYIFISNRTNCSQHKDEYHCGLWLGHLGATDSDWDHSTNEQPGLGLSLLRSFTCSTPQFPWAWVCTCFCFFPSSSSSNIDLVLSLFFSLPLYLCLLCIGCVCLYQSPFILLI